MSATDAELVAAHAAGDPDALGQLWARHQRYVLSVIAHLLGHRRDAEDIAQDVAVALVRSLHRWEARASLTSWLYRVTRNAVFDHLRRSAVRAHESIDVVHRDEIDAVVSYEERGYRRHEDAAELAGLLAGLAPDRADAVVLIHHDGLPLDAAAEWLGVPVGTVKSRCSRGLAELRAAVA